MVLAACPLMAGSLSEIGQLPFAAKSVVILGEVHDNPIHHQNQAQAIALIEPRALVFEMLSAEQAEAARSSDRANLDELAEATDWAASGWPDFAMYFPIFSAAPDALVYGAAVPRDRITRAMKEGAEAVIQVALPPVGPEELSERVALQAEAHCDALPEAMLPGMVEAQRLRDASFALTTRQALRETGGPVVVITGNGHARNDWGMPAHLRATEPDLDILSLGQLEAEPADPPPFDVWIVTEAADREDPCAAFR